MTSVLGLTVRTRLFLNYFAIQIQCHALSFSPRTWWHKDQTFLYMLMEYVPGGELFSYLRSAGRFSSAAGNFFASEIIVALDYLHSKSIVYRDLKPENLLLDRDGHLKITDFGFAKIVDDR